VDWLKIAHAVADLPEVKRLAAPLLRKVAPGRRYAFLLGASEVVWQSVEYSRTHPEARVTEPFDDTAEFAARLGMLCQSSGQAAPDEKEWVWLKAWLAKRSALSIPA